MDESMDRRVDHDLSKLRALYRGRAAAAPVWRADDGPGNPRQLVDQTRAYVGRDGRSREERTEPDTALTRGDRGGRPGIKRQGTSRGEI